MKKQFKIIMHVITMLLVLVIGCTKDNIPIVEEPTEKEITIQVDMPDNTELRVAENTFFELTWEEGDQLLVVGLDDAGDYKGKSTFTYTGTPNKASGPFTGKAINEAVKYKIYYPATITIDEESGSVTYSFMNEQKQEANGSTAHLKKYIVLENTEISDLTVAIRLTMMSSIVKFDLTNIPAQVGTLKKLEWEVETDTGTKIVSMNFASDAITFSASENNLTAYKIGRSHV